MADDTQTSLPGALIQTSTFNATRDGSNVLTLQSTPRTNGAEVTVDNPLPNTQSRTTYSGVLTVPAATSTPLAAGGAVVMDPNSGALPVAGNFKRLTLFMGSGTVNVSWFGGTATASVGERMGDGSNVGTDTVNLTGNPNAPSFYSISGCVIWFRN